MKNKKNEKKINHKAHLLNRLVRSLLFILRIGQIFLWPHSGSSKLELCVCDFEYTAALLLFFDRSIVVGAWPGCYFILVASSRFFFFFSSSLRSKQRIHTYSTSTAEQQSLAFLQSILPKLRLFTAAWWLFFVDCIYWYSMGTLRESKPKTKKNLKGILF